MEVINRRLIDWESTGKNLALLRLDNINLRRYVCFYNNTVLSDKCDSKCCEECTYDMDHSISRLELANVFNVSDSVIFNWENNKTIPSMDDILFYSDMCKLDIDSIVIYEK